MKNILLLILTTFSLSAFAENVWHQSTIKTIYPQSDGGFVIIFDSSSLNCSRPDKYHFVSANQNGVTQEGVNSMLSVVLTAATLNKSIMVYFDKESSSCVVNRLQVEF